MRTEMEVVGVGPCVTHDKKKLVVMKLSAETLYK